MKRGRLLLALLFVACSRPVSVFVTARASIRGNGEIVCAGTP